MSAAAVDEAPGALGAQREGMVMKARSQKRMV